MSTESGLLNKPLFIGPLVSLVAFGIIGTGGYFSVRSIINRAGSQLTIQGKTASLPAQYPDNGNTSVSADDSKQVANPPKTTKPSRQSAAPAQKHSKHAKKKHGK